MKSVKTAILISGGGSNMEALIRATHIPSFPAHIALVMSNRPQAGGLEKARALGVTTDIIDHKTFATREKFERTLHAKLDKHRIELVCTAGFMRLLSPWFVSRWTGRLLNIHPSLLPKFKGLNTHARALKAGESEHGCTVHHVNEQMDGGEIIAQKSVPVRADDTAETLAARVLKQEHLLYPRALKNTAMQLLALTKK